MGLGTTFRACVLAGVAGVGALTALPGAARAQCTADWATHLPTVRTDADMAYDPVRQRVVLFGGANGALYLGDTWEFDGARWTLAATNGPPARRGHKMVYDTANRRTLLVGGYVPGQTGSVDVWAWDGATWRLIDDAGPAFTFSTLAQNQAAIAFDQSRAVLVLVLSNGQTWEFSGVPGGWTQKSAPGPSARRGMAMGYDRISGLTYLFGGTIGAARQSDTWSWDGEVWQNLNISGPSARTEARTAFDTAHNRLLLYGGTGPASVRLRDTWAFDGTAWQQLLATGPTTMASNGGAALVFDGETHQTILLGGNVSPWADICTLDADATGWTQTVFGPGSRSGAAAAYDAARGRAVVFGGLGSTRFGDTWEFDGGRWMQVATTGPSARNESAMAYDPVRHRTVLFGGNTGVVNGETWEWDGAAWTLVSSTGPSPRDRHAMTYDPNLGGVLLHGGAVSGGAANNETWLWNGAAWSRVGTGPTRYSHAMVYSPTLDRVVLYGGSGAGVDQRAFVWDGSAWTQVGGTGPSTATEHAMVFDPDSARVALVGASSGDAAIWFFDGQTWVRSAHTGNTPRGRTNQCAWFDAQRDRLVMFGGTASGVASRETWEFRGVAGPEVVSVPTWEVSCRRGEAAFTVRLAPGEAASGVVWLRNGFSLEPGQTAWGSGVEMETSEDGLAYTLRLSSVSEADNGGYQCILSSACGGATVTNPAVLRVCPADFNCSGTGSGDGITTQDIFDFLAALFAGDLHADINRDGLLSVGDLFEFLTAYFGGC